MLKRRVKLFRLALILSIACAIETAKRRTAEKKVQRNPNHYHWERVQKTQSRNQFDKGSFFRTLEVVILNGPSLILFCVCWCVCVWEGGGSPKQIPSEKYFHTILFLSSRICEFVIERLSIMGGWSTPKF